MAHVRSPAGPLVKVAVALAVVSALGLAFWRSVRSSRAAPFVASEANLRSWTLAVEHATQPSDPVLMLLPAPALSAQVFDQVFKRSMESMRSPETVGIPLVFAGELGRAGAAALPPDELLALARRSGLEEVPPRPRCVAHRRAPEPDARQQAYFVVFDSQPFEDFRTALAARLGAGFVPAAASPILLVGLVESSQRRWLPLRVDAATDCVAPLEITAGGS